MAVSGQVRTVIELFCKILDDNSLSSIRAETLRQAKFNKDSGTQSLWELLFHIIYFCKNHTPSQPYRPSLVQISQENQVRYVKAELQKWGYLNRTMARLPTGMSYGSRELLLALGWVIHTQKLFEKIVSSRTSPLKKDFMQVLNPEAYSTNTESQPSHVAAVTKFRNPHDAIQYQLMLCGKLRLSLRRLYMVHQQLAGLKHTITQSTEGVSLQADRNHLTPMEVYLLRYPNSLKKMLADLERDNEQLKNLLDWREKEHVFWEWMESVLSLHIQEKNNQERPDSAIPVEEVFLPVPPTTGEDIVAVRTKLRDFILKHEADIERMEELVLRKKVSRVEVEVLTHHIDKEISELALRLQQCGRGWTTDQDEELNVGAFSSNDTPDQVSSITNTHGKSRPKFVMQSAQALRAEKQANMLELARQERASLEKRIQQLEMTLKQMEIDNMQKLTSVTAQDPNMICIQPRHCKQFYSS